MQMLRSPDFCGTNTVGAVKGLLVSSIMPLSSMFWSWVLTVASWNSTRWNLDRCSYGRNKMLCHICWPRNTLKELFIFTYYFYYTRTCTFKIVNVWWFLEFWDHTFFQCVPGQPMNCCYQSSLCLCPLCSFTHRTQLLNFHASLQLSNLELFEPFIVSPLTTVLGYWCVLPLRLLQQATILCYHCNRKLLLVNVLIFVQSMPCLNKHELMVQRSLIANALVWGS